MALHLNGAPPGRPIDIYGLDSEPVVHALFSPQDVTRTYIMISG